MEQSQTAKLAQAAAPPQVVQTPTTRSSRKPRRSFSIQSKLLLALFGVSLLSSGVISVQAYRNGTNTVSNAVYNQLTEVRASRAATIERFFATFRNQVLSYSESLMFIAAMREFEAGYRELSTEQITPEQSARIDSYYRDTFIPRLAANTDSKPAVEGYIPQTPAQHYLQANYTVNTDSFDERIEIDNPGDESAYTQANQKYNPLFRNLVQRFGWYDLMFIDTDGNVVYTAYKGLDLGINLSSDQYADTAFGKAFAEAVTSGDTQFVKFTDFERYRPGAGAPAAFTVSTIFDGPTLIGVLAIQLPVATINDLMTDSGKWAENGLGKTGETYLVGSDYLMRSQSRFFIEDKEAYKQQVLAAGADRAQVERSLRLNTTILEQSAQTPHAEAAQRGETGTLLSRDYRNAEVLTSYAPLDWAIVAQMDTSEAMQPVNNFARNVALLMAAIALSVSLLSMLLARLLARPISQIAAGVNRVAQGDLSTDIPMTSSDELGAVASSFNDMMQSLRVKNALIEQKDREIEQTLLNIMPTDFVQRYKEGQEIIAQQHQNVSVLYADMVGLNELSESMAPDAAATMLNRLIRTIDEAAEQYGVEKVRTIGTSYLAACGLSVPRVDNAKRTLDFARTVQQIIARFNRDNNADLDLRIGIDTGSVTAGLVGKNKFVYDMWGDTVNLAHRVQSIGGENSILVTRNIYDRLRDMYSFQQVGEIETKQRGKQPVWAVGA